MSSADLLSMCLRNLLKRKLRTILTILGVVVGTAAIVVMVSLGLAVNARFAGQMDKMGDVTLITLYDYSGNRYGMSVQGQGDQQSPAPKLDDYAIARFEQIPGVVVATPVLNAELFFKSGKYTMQSWNCMGVKPEAMPLLGYEAEEGRLLSPGDGDYDVVFGNLAEKNFHDPRSGRWEDRFYGPYIGGEETATYVDIFKDTINMSYDSRYLWTEEDAAKEYDPDDENAPRPIRPIELNVVGRMTFRESDYTYLSSIYFDIEVLKELKAAAEKAQRDNSQEWGQYSALRGGASTTYEQAYVKVDDLNRTQEVFDQIKEMGFEGFYPAQWLAAQQETMQSLQILLAAIGGVSLFVAAIGIANTMVMSIYERTREIGVMKVIGAAIRDIKWLFLLESAMIGFFGGLLGVGFSLLVSYFLNNADIALFGEVEMMMGEEAEKALVSLITPWLAGSALGFAGLIGLLSGYFPARRAMRLSALSAIRTE